MHLPINCNGRQGLAREFLKKVEYLKINTIMAEIEVNLQY